MLASFSLPILILVFSLAAAAVWYAGIHLSNTTDAIDVRFDLGEAFGGLIVLSTATNLPEIAIVISAAIDHHIGIAIGNILGGIAIQTVVLVVLDVVGLGKAGPLTYQAASLQLVLEGMLVISVILIVIMGTQLPQTYLFAHLAPADLLIVCAWLVGLWLIYKGRTGLPWHKSGRAPDTTKPEKNITQEQMQHWSLLKVLSVFTVAAIVTLIAGYFLEQSGSIIAHHIGWSGVIFGSTILAAVTALPEIATGLAAMKIKDYTLAISDIFGGNAFLPVLFFPATLLSGQSAIPQAQKTDIYLASLGALLTAVYIYGLILRPKKQILSMGFDSLVVLILYILGIIGLLTYF